MNEDLELVSLAAMLGISAGVAAYIIGAFFAARREQQPPLVQDPIQEANRKLRREIALLVMLGAGSLAVLLALPPPFQLPWLVFVTALGITGAVIQAVRQGG